LPVVGLGRCRARGAAGHRAGRAALAAAPDGRAHCCAAGGARASPRPR